MITLTLVVGQEERGQVAGDALQVGLLHDAQLQEGSRTMQKGRQDMFRTSVKTVSAGGFIVLREICFNVYSSLIPCLVHAFQKNL